MRAGEGGNGRQSQVLAWSHGNGDASSVRLSLAGVAIVDSEAIQEGTSSRDNGKSIC